MRYIIGSALATIGASDAVLDIIGVNPSLVGAILLILGGGTLALTGKHKSNELVVTR